MTKSIRIGMRKTVSVALAALMVLLLMPITPRTSQAFADEGSQGAMWSPVQATDDVTGLASTVVYNNRGENNAEQQTVDNSSLSKKLQSDGILSTPQNPAGVPAAVSQNLSDNKEGWLESDAKAAVLGEAQSNLDGDDALQEKALTAAKTAAEKWLMDDAANKDGLVWASALTEAKKTLEDSSIAYEDGSLKVTNVVTDKNEEGHVAIDLTNASVAASAVEIAVMKGSREYTAGPVVNTSSFGWQLDKLYATKVLSSNSDVLSVDNVSVGKDDSLSFDLTAKSAGTSTMAIEYEYTRLINSYEYGYSAKYDYTYKVHYVLTGWKYSGAFSYEYTEKQATSADPAPTLEGGSSGATDASSNDPSESAKTEPTQANGVLGAKTEVRIPTTPIEGDLASDVTVKGAVIQKNDRKAEVNGQVFSAAPDEVDPQAGIYTQENVQVVDLFPGIANAEKVVKDDGQEGVIYSYKNNPKEVDLFTNGDDEPILFGGESGDYAAANKAQALAVLGQPKVVIEPSGNDATGLTAEYDEVSGKLTVTPKNVGQNTITVTWESSGTQKEPIVQTVSVNVLPKTIIVKDPAAQPFRAQQDQQDRVCEVANDNLREQIKDATGDEIDDSYYQSVYLANYDKDGKNPQSFDEVDVKWSLNDDVSAYSNYEITNPKTVGIDPIQSIVWKETGLSLLATNGVDPVLIDHKNAEEKWINSTPEATWVSHKLAYATKGVPEQNDSFDANPIKLSSGDGVHNVEMYALNQSDEPDENNVIVNVTNISYMLDTQTPVLTGAEASAPERSQTFNGILFGENSVEVNLSLVDEVKQNRTETSDTLVVKSSGVASDLTKAWYTDQENGQEDISADLSGAAPNYSFSIKGDKDVPTSSIKVQSVDNAGNVLNTTADKSRDIPIEYSRLVADASAPQIDVSWDSYDAHNGRYYNTDRSMTLTVSEEFFNYVVDYGNDQVITTVFQNGQAIIAVHPSDFTEVSKNVWQYTLGFTVDADWEVSAPTVFDIVGRSAAAAGDSFTIDKTAPTMEVSFDNNNAANGMYYNAARTATVTVTEHNFSGNLINIQPTANAGNGDAVGQPSISGWSDSGDIHTATVTFPGEGVYAMTIDGMDLATNTLANYTCPEFIVDTIKPQIDISGIENMMAYGQTAAAQPNVAVHDTNLDSSSKIDIQKISYPIVPNDTNPYPNASTITATDLTAAYANPAIASENDGVYTMVVDANDMAGNTNSQAITWSVNRFGSTYVVHDDTSNMIGKYLQGSKAKNVVVTEINPSGLNENETAVELTKDAKNKTLALNSEYQLSQNSDSAWHEYTYDIAKSNYNADGSYRVLFHSQDTAGNASENTMSDKNANRSGDAVISFAVDNTAPTLGYVNLAAGTTYEEAEHNASVTIEDNLLLDHAEIMVNGTKYASLSSDDLKGSKAHDIVLSEGADTQNVSVVAYDAAGNKSEDLVADGVFVNSDPVKLWIHNTPLFIGSIIGGVGIVAAAAAVIALIARRKSASDASGR